METIQNREKFIQIVSERGYQGLLNHLRGLFPNLDLYSMSQDWMNSPGFILKAKGGYGDLLVKWEQESGDVLKLGKTMIEVDTRKSFSVSELDEMLEHDGFKDVTLIRAEGDFYDYTATHNGNEVEVRVEHDPIYDCGQYFVNGETHDFWL